MNLKQNAAWLGGGIKVMAWLIVVVTLVWIAWAVTTRVTAAPVAQADIRRSFESAKHWVQAHEGAVLGETNSALWWMMRLAAEKSRDPYLNQLYARRMASAYEVGQPSMWEKLIEPRLSAWINFEEAAQTEPYQQFILYGATCDKGIGELPGIRKNSSRWFCKWALPWAIFRDPACTSHQMVGVLLIKERHCPASFDVPLLERQLMSDIGQQLVADPRVSDGYIQRVMVQAMSGGLAAIDQVALRRVLSAQGKDGGWANQHVLWDGGSGRVIAFSHLPFPRLTTERLFSDFHATAQGLLLMALAMQH